MRKNLINMLNPKRKEVKKMKKLVFFALVAIFVVALAGVGMADVINPGPFGEKYLDQTFADVFGPDASNNIWGVISLTGTHNLLDGNTENQNLSGVAYYTPGSDGFYYFGVYGGLHITSPVVGPGTYYLDAASGITPYMNIYKVPVAQAGAYDAAVTAGPNVAGLGAPGTFGSAIITAPGAELFLALTPEEDYLSTYYGTPAGILEEFVFTSILTGKTTAYWDVIGGSGASLIMKDSFPFFPNLYTDHVINGVYADLKIVSDLTQETTNPFGWNTSSEDPVTGISGIPEPSTIILLGMGLLGIGIFGRKRMKK
jgi:hypothetical protein